MAKARPIPGLDEDDSYAAAAAKVVAIRASELAEHAAGVLDTSDIERVHSMRVATRRLRAALEVFEPCFPRKRFRAALAEVKLLADALGERRDRDVTIVALTEFEARAGQAEAPGVRSLIDRIRAEQTLANEALVPLVTAERMRALDERLRELVAATREPAGEAPGAAPEREATEPTPPPPTRVELAPDGDQAEAPRSRRLGAEASRA